MRMPGLIENETLKLLRRRRFAIVIGILMAILSVVSYAEYRQLARHADRDWRVETQQHIARYQNVIRRARVNPSWERSLRAEIARLQYYLDHDIPPDRPTAPFFVRQFANVAGYVLLPLLIAVLGSDIVSAENSEGTDKLLLTRPLRRWKILTSKVGALFLFSTLTLVCGGVLATVIGSIALEPRGWSAPVFIGFWGGGAKLDVATVRQIPLWLDIVLAYGLEWFALLCVASVALLLSVLFRSGAASIGTMLATLIGGTILTRVSPDWVAGKYLFVSALPLAAYFGGEPPPYDGMSLAFCVSLLGGWAVVTLALAYFVFTRRDVLG
ncbi:MAG: ABC transporter permease [Thermoanaerobaculia bacterium]